MTVCRALPLAVMLVAIPFAAAAQFGGMPGMPGSAPGGMPGGGFGGQPQAQPQPQQPPAACQQLMTLRDDTQKHGLAIQKANERKASVQDACRMFKTFLASEAKFIKGIEEHSRTCGIPPDVLKQVKESHAKAGQIGKDVCDAAAQAANRPAGPSLSDALGTTPTMPDGSGKKERGGTFDTLSGNVLQR
jgi:hypothetical protein